MMKRTEFTPQKRHKATTDNEEATTAHKEKNAQTRAPKLHQRSAIR
jgi:hypothetical protein